MATQQLLSQNGKMREQGIWNWTLPAGPVRLESQAPDGTLTVRNVNVCPSASECLKHCYARGKDSAYIRFPAVRAKHLRNLQMVLDTPLLWRERMAAELRHPRYQPNPKTGAAGEIRIHDSGDFYDDPYTLMWLDIILGAPKYLRFYAYTKEVSRARRLLEPNRPKNLTLIYSLGGKEDDLIDRDRDRHADVFPTLAALEKAGYSSQAASDLLAAYGPKRVGMTINRRGTHLPASFGELQQQRGAEATARLERQLAKARASR
ncbi:GP88 family protein [Streptomyces sp. NPDC055140]